MKGQNSGAASWSGGLEIGWGEDGIPASRTSIPGGSVTGFSSAQMLLNCQIVNLRKDMAM
jgi:hypothetical protein